MEFLIILVLIIISGIFSLAEMAIVSVRKHRLHKLAQENDTNALIALELSKNPNRFLSTTQIGITLVGIISGALGEATMTNSLSKILQHVPYINLYSKQISFILVIIIITYLTLIIGELVPKRIALHSPEKIARIIAKPMDFLSRIAGPFVSILSLSTDLLLKIFRIKTNPKNQVSEEEVRLLIKEGTEGGIFEIAEKNIVERTFRLSDRHVNSLMTPRKQIVWISVDNTFTTIKNKIAKKTHAFYPVCKNNLDQVVGIVRTETLLTNFLVNEKIKIENLIHKPLFIPANTPALKVLELFKQSGIHMALIVDEYGMIEGVISLTDILEAIVGDIPEILDDEPREIVRRDKKTWFVDGLLSIEECREYFSIKRIPGEKTNTINTVGGYIMHRLGRIPKTGDVLQVDKYTFEVVDMDGNRVDKIIVSKKTR